MLQQIKLNKFEIQEAADHAKVLELGGKSFRDSDDRKKYLSQDQLVGVVGEMAFSLYLTGSIDKWRVTKQARLRCIGTGDGGSDLIGLNVDVKTSLVRSIDRPLWEYHLAVRPNELHNGITYVLILVTELGEESATCNVMGFAESEDFGAPMGSGIFEGAHAIPANQLNRLPSLRWF